MLELLVGANPNGVARYIGQHPG